MSLFQFYVVKTCPSLLICFTMGITLNSSSRIEGHTGFICQSE